MSDIFDVAFDAMVHSLNSIAASVPGSSGSETAAALSLNRKWESKLDAACKEQLLQESRKRLGDVQAMRRQALSRLYATLSQRVNDQQCVEARVDLELAACETQHLLAQRRLSTQLAGAERRIRELVFEIIGEYNKSELRVLRRTEYLSYASRIQEVWTVWRLCWERFALRLCYEATATANESLMEGNKVTGSQQQLESIKSVTLCPLSDGEEYAAVEARLRKKLALKPTARVTAVLRFLKSGPVASSSVANQHAVFKALPCATASTSQEVRDFLPVLRAWATKSSPVNNKVMRPPTPTKRAADNKSPTHAVGQNGSNTNSSSSSSSRSSSSRAKQYAFLRASSIEWLHPQSYSSHVFDRLAEADIGNSQASQPSASLASAPATAEALQSFLCRFTAQHASFVVSDRVFFCLEERAAACRDGPLMDLNADSTPDSTMALLQQLQNVYDSDSRASGGAAGIRTALSSPLLVENQSIGRHRSETDGGTSSDPAASSSDSHDILNFPDVVSARPLPVGPKGDQQVLHFAPASTTQLIETASFGQARLKTEGIRAIGRAIHHPCLALLARPRDDGHDSVSPLSTLYVMVRIVQARNKTSEVARLVMMPLPSLAIQELLRCSLSLSSAVSASLIPAAPEGPSTLPSSALSPVPPRTPEGPTPSLFNGASFTDLLPDRARVRPASAHPSSEVRTPSRPSGSSQREKSSAAQRCRHLYALLPEEYVYTLPGNSGSSSSSGASSPVRSRQCYYLVQILEDATTQATAVPLSPTIAADSALELHANDDSFLDTVLLARARGLLTGGERERGAVKGEKGASEDRKWDSTILSSLCRWRSCLCEATPSPPKYLCAYHSDLCIYLEGNPAGKVSPTGEASKYLPKKAPILPSANVLCDPQRDLRMIRAASTLLQELWDGKLRATVKSFTKKVAQDMALRRRLETALQGITAAQAREAKENKNRAPDDLHYHVSQIERTLSIPRPPSYSVWRDETALSDTLTAQATRHAALDSIRSLEQAVSNELRQLLDMRVYPSAELAAIRKEVRGFRDSFFFEDGGAGNNNAGASERGPYLTPKETEEAIQTTSAELRLAEKKLQILRARRNDEALARDAMQRKAARSKAIEALQMSDPTNFAYASASRF